MTNEIDDQVLAFYKNLPFNTHAAPKGQIEAIRKRNPVLAYPVLPPLLKPQTSVLEVGCGTGWMSNSIAHYFGNPVTGIDFNPNAIDYCRQVAQALRLNSVFLTEDLFAYRPAQPFGMALSLGVLHHTHDCHAAIRRICNEFVAPEGYAFIGLYHRYGRKPFLDHFQTLRENGASEADLLARYRQLHSYLDDETHLQSWFRDQVLHPHETQHTLAEILPLLEETGCSLVATSLNNFQAIESIDPLIASEQTLYDVGVKRLQENRYYPGFFLLLARKDLQ